LNSIELSLVGRFVISAAGCYLGRNFHLPFGQVTSKWHLPEFIFACSWCSSILTNIIRDIFSFSLTFIGWYVLYLYSGLYHCGRFKEIRPYLHVKSRKSLKKCFRF
jgi:hypothetical protein